MRTARQVQLERYRDASLGAKLQIVCDLNQTADAFAEAGIRQRHPDATDRQVRLHLAALKLDRDLMIEVYGWDPEVEGR